MLWLPSCAQGKYNHNSPHPKKKFATEPEFKVKIIDPINKPIPEFLQQFDYNQRINRVTCSAASWIDFCADGKWNDRQINALKENEKHKTQIKESVKNVILKLFEVFFHS